jgi:hypothetical protein
MASSTPNVASRADPWHPIVNTTRPGRSRFMDPLVCNPSATVMAGRMRALAARGACGAIG